MKTDDGVEIASAYTGTVTLRMPSFDERVAFYDDADVEMYPEGQSSDALRVRNKKLMRHVSKKIKDHFVRAEIVRTSDGFKITQLEQLQYDTDMMMVMMEIAQKLVGKFSVGAVGNGGSNISPNMSQPSTAATPDPGIQQAS